ncbi:phenolphthiocerol/phthiocerol polyketide synthase subunit C-like [Saccostrea cucullata]|uniref:phenolphthiocerol/phthiocerol polyketide synthase subunit C-like n=1 Tax=Saccostrea cuccullata TaxID=36930 RepID=UPI002ED2ABF9
MIIAGGLNNDWGSLLRVTNENSRNTSVTSVDTSILSARVAYFYNLLGPALTINTACSSSMVAIDTAMQALKNGEISMAICGGVNVILDPDTYIGLSCARMASPTGKCHTFSVEADGYARGEGCGVVLLKRLTNAIHDKNKIWGTIYTKLKQDGHMSTPITSPSGKQQERLLENFQRKQDVPSCTIR